MSRSLWKKIGSIEKKVNRLGEKPPQLPDDPISFCENLLGFKPTTYQTQLLESDSKRIVVRWARQSGKTTTLAAISIIRASSNPGYRILIISPGLRQSMILGDRIRSLLEHMPAEYKPLILQSLKTIFRFRNGSSIIVLPNSEHQLRGFTADLIIADEAAFFHNDESIFKSILPPMLATTDGTLIVSSTPWGRNTVYYSLNNNPEYEKHVVTWRQAYGEGIYHKGFLEHIQKQQETNPQAYSMEYEAEFAEEADTWLTQDLLAKACLEDLDYHPFESSQKGRFYMGIDLAERVDYSVIAIIEKAETLHLVLMHRFPLKTSLATVIGYAKLLSQRWRRIHATYVDHTKHGDYIIEDMKKAGVSKPQGVTFTVNSKQEMAQILKTRLTQGKLHIPYDRSLLDELNTEKYHLTKNGRIIYSHPNDTHDDKFWALALAVYAAEQKPEIHTPKAQVK